MKLTYYNYHYKSPLYISSLVDELDSLYTLSLDYSPRNYRGSISCLAYNLVRMVKHDYSVCATIMGNSLRLPTPIVNGKVIGVPPSRSNTISLLNTLERLGLITINRGYRINEDKRESSYFALSPGLQAMVERLVDMDKVKIKLQDDTVVLRDENKIQIKYNRTEGITNMIEQVEAFNSEFSEHEITHRNEVIDVALKRIFNAGSFMLGGRFYEGHGNIQTLPPEERKHIKIDGKDCISLDYSALHLSIAYSLRGVYWLEGFCPYSVELGESAMVYPEELYDFTSRFGKDASYNPIRNLIKISVLIMINAKSTQAAMGAIRDKFKKDELKQGTENESGRLFAGIDKKTLDIGGVMNKIAEHNSEVKSYFNSGMGTKLQFIDSQIMAGILQDLYDQNIVALPIHDSLIVAANNQEKLLKSMVSNYKKICGSDHNCKITAKW